MDYQHKDVRSFWRGWTEAIRKHPGRTLGLLIATTVSGAALVFAVAYLSSLGAQMAKTETTVSGLTQQISEMRLDVRQAVTMKQQVSQTVNVITEVQKEIANIRETIDAFYGQAQEELFTAADVGTRVRMFRTNTTTAVFFELKGMPLPKSITLNTSRGTVAGATYSVFHNILQFRTTEEPAEFFADVQGFKRFCFVRYFTDSSATGTLFTLTNMKWIGSEEDVTRAVYYPRSLPNKSVDHYVSPAADGG